MKYASGVTSCAIPSTRPAFCFQGHPEASPGPRDVDYLFDRFIKLMAERHR